ncbi:MAG: spermidine/putrescine ABC transporter substrate-binding protein [Clostridia bacterium]|nr:spermidine/putrescine ABC transporter substrate-binding protein [Clostridia bacterium]
MKRIALVLLVALVASAFSAFGLAETEKPFAGTELTVYNWFDYIDLQVLDIFEEETGIHINYANFEENEDMYTRLAAGAGEYDVIIPSEYMIERLIREDRLEPLDHANIPNMENVIPALLDASYDPGNTYSVPYMWGTLGILYNADMVEEPVTSWDALFDERYAGKIYMMDSMRDSIGIVLKKLGYSMNSTSEEELQEAGELLLKQRDDGLIAGYILDTAKDKMASNEAVMAVMYNGDAMYAIKDNPSLVYVIPEEGSNVWVDAMCIPKGSAHKEAAELFIDFMCRPDIAKMNVDEIRYSPLIRQVVEGLSEEELASTAMNPSEEELARCEYYHDISDVAWMYDDVWMDVTF